MRECTAGLQHVHGGLQYSVLRGPKHAAKLVETTRGCDSNAQKHDDIPRREKLWVPLQSWWIFYIYIFILDLLNVSRYLIWFQEAGEAGAQWIFFPSVRHRLMLSIVMPEEEKETYVNGQLLQETMQDVPSALLRSKHSQGFKVMKFWRLFFCLWVVARAIK